MLLLCFMITRLRQNVFGVALTLVLIHKRHRPHGREFIRFKPIYDGANLMNKIIHEVCSLINLLDINRGFGLILTRSARYTGSVTGFRDTRLGQVAEPKGPKDEPPFMQKT